MECKDALITPIYKKGDRSSAAKYRPVSLTCVVCKILENIILSSVMKYLPFFHYVLTPVGTSDGYSGIPSAEGVS